MFIVHHKSIAEDDFRKAFEKYGNIEEIWMLKDRATGDLKGMSKTGEKVVLNPQNICTLTTLNSIYLV